MLYFGKEITGNDNENLNKLWHEFYENITDSIPIDRLEEICQAEREGRCVVLPCKVEK
jgi:hypothetical protein